MLHKSCRNVSLEINLDTRDQCSCFNMRMRIDSKTTIFRSSITHQYQSLLPPTPFVQLCVSDVTLLVPLSCVSSLPPTLLSWSGIDHNHPSIWVSCKAAVSEPSDCAKQTKIHLRLQWARIRIDFCLCSYGALLRLAYIFVPPPPAPNTSFFRSCFRFS